MKSNVERLDILRAIFSDKVVDTLIATDYIGNCERVNCVNDVKLLEECGELVAIVSKAIANKENYETRAKQINTELADVIITIGGFISRNNMDIEDIVSEIVYKLNRFKDVK